MTSLLYGLAGKLLGELSSPFLKDVGKSWGSGTKDEFEKLKNTLSAIEAVLLDAEEKQRTKHQVQDWLKKIKLVFYDVEDLLQELAVEALVRQVTTRNKKVKKVHTFFSSSNQVVYRFKMGHEVKLVRERLDAIASDSNAFNLIERQQDMHVVMMRSETRREESHSFVPIERFIGREEDKTCIVELLTNSPPHIAKHNVAVISIVGIGGLGKTCLAQSVYKTMEVKSHFDVMMWVCVSNVFDVRLVCEKTIESATLRKPRMLHMDGIQKELKDAIDGKRYLLVLDDVWNESPIKWMDLEELLLGGAQGSRILITTRSELVARAAKSVSTYFLKGMSEEESWSLFKQVAFKHGQEPPSSTIIAVGKEVVEKCAGVPLAIKTIGSMLGLKQKEDDWSKFRKNDLHRITRDSKNGIVPTLRLSYDYLSAPLKRCLAYCAVFPKKYKIVKETLIRMWIAQGLVQLDDRTRTLEDVGEQHFMDLLDRSFIEVDVLDIGHDEIVHCKMHDLIHDLALSVGGNECCNLGLDVMNDVDETTRHASVSKNVPPELYRAAKLRTLVVANRIKVDELLCDEIVSKFKYMRVLDLRWSLGGNVSGFIGGLRHLSYLDLSRNKFSLLPDSICNLYNLQTLILVGCYALKELPTETRNLVSLRHLDITGCNKLSQMPPRMGELTCLQNLSDFVTGPPESTAKKNCSELGELKSLVNLRGHLRITNLRSKRGRQSHYPPGMLTHLEFVEYLLLNWKYDGRAKDEDEEEEEDITLFECLKPHSNLKWLYIDHYRGKRFPSWMDKVSIRVSLPNIVTVRLNNCTSWKDLPPFGLLPSLQVLGLYEMGGIEYLYDEDDQKKNCASSSSSSSVEPLQLFPSLKRLAIRNVPSLCGLGRRRRKDDVGGVCPRNIPRPQHFPVLEELQITKCPLFVGEEDGNQLVSLSKVHFYSSSDMETLPGWLQYVRNLQILQFTFCDKIVSLPEWMVDLTLLKEIHIEDCKSLVSVPDCVQRLTSLQRLVVRGCAELVKRCQKETGEDWDIIAHIPDISLG